VDEEGNLTRSSGEPTSELIEGSEFEVVFTKDVTACSYQATVESTTPGFASVASGALEDGVRVFTANAEGEGEALPFHLAVFC